MTIEGTYEPSTWDWVKEQVETYERSGGTQANTLRETGMPIIVMTCTGHKTGNVRKVPLMRVEYQGDYAIVASKGGAPAHPGWYHNLVADPTVTVQDGPEPFAASVRIVTGDERTAWWERAVTVFPPYAEYQDKTDREIPLFVTVRS
jgi:deazaflavin-dependent oxidoreductase (nitroreductase family)